MNPMEPTSVEVDAFVTFTLAILLLFVGKELTQRMPTLRKYSIPEPVVGGFLCTLVVGLVYFVANIRIHFDLNVRDLLLLYFLYIIQILRCRRSYSCRSRWYPYH